MNKKNEHFFWISFSDLVTSLFFIMMVLYILTYVQLKKKERQLVNTVKDLEYKLSVYETVEQNLKPLKQNTSLFRYEDQYKRFTLAFDVNFERGRYRVAEGDLQHFEVTASRIRSVGRQLQATIDQLAKNRNSNPAMKNVSYLLIISGYASHLPYADRPADYSLSYQRAYHLWAYWSSIGIDFEAARYKGLIDLQLSGNGWGGAGRFRDQAHNSLEMEIKNQRFIIQIVPKIGNILQEQDKKIK